MREENVAAGRRCRGRPRRGPFGDIADRLGRGPCGKSDGGLASFELEGQRFNALNGGPKYRFNEAISFFISVETQQEVDYFWNRLSAGGGEGNTGG
jgi:predicted 3-demethylubiquinone-9 3-methyltransferase (glyoxalase superfamily)